MIEVQGDFCSVWVHHVTTVTDRSANIRLSQHKQVFLHRQSIFLTQTMCVSANKGCHGSSGPHVSGPLHLPWIPLSNSGTTPF